MYAVAALHIRLQDTARLPSSRLPPSFRGLVEVRMTVHDHIVAGHPHISQYLDASSGVEVQPALTVALTKAVASRNPGIRPGRRPDRKTLQKQAQEGSAHTAQATVLAH
jgi:hypothetical protein